jgi:hypothetical protein
MPELQRQVYGVLHDELRRQLLQELYPGRVKLAREMAGAAMDECRALALHCMACASSWTCGKLQDTT